MQQLKNEKTFRDLGSGFVVVQCWGCLPKCMDVPPMIFTGNPLIIKPGMVFFMRMILMNNGAQLAMNLGETYLVTESGNERLGKQKLDLVIL